MLQLARWTAWTLVAVLVFVTLAPIDLRPEIAASPNFERMLAYALVGFTFSLAYPRHRWLALVMIVGIAGVLEAGQMLTVTRHGRLPDFAVKALAAALGCLLGAALPDLRRRGPARS